MDDAVWNHAVFSKNRDRLLNSEVAQRFFTEVNRLAKRFMSDEHFTVDGTLIQAWASQKSFRPRDGSDDDDGTNFRGQKRSHDTHQSTTDPDARLYKKSYGQESKLAYPAIEFYQRLEAFTDALIFPSAMNYLIHSICRTLASGQGDLLGDLDRVLKSLTLLG